MQQHLSNLAASSLHDHCIHLARDGTMQFFAKTSEAFRKASRDPGAMDGRLLALHHVSSARDVHYPDWEMHPAGDELLIVASGSLSVEYRQGETTHTAALPSPAAFIVPAGVWHRVIVHESSVLIAITPRLHTTHEKG